MCHVRIVALFIFLALGGVASANDTAPTPSPSPSPSSDAPMLRDPEVVEIYDRAVAGESPVAFSNLSRLTLEEEGAFRDIPTLLSELPSVMWFSENGNGIGYNYLTIRGFDQRRISVMVDGVPQNDPEDHNVYWVNFFDLGGSLEDVQVQRGGGAYFYGPPAIGGSINMVTRRFEAEPYGRLALGIGVYDPRNYDGPLIAGQRYTGEFGSGRIGKGRFEDRITLYGRFSHLRSPGYREGSWSRYWRGFLGAELRSAKSTLRLQAYGGPQYDGLAYYGIPKADNVDPVARRGNVLAGTDIEVFNQTHYDLIHTYTPNAQLAVTNTVFYLRGHGYFDFGGYWGSPDYFRFTEALPTDLAGLYYPSGSEPESAPAEGIPDDTLLRAYVGNDQVGWLPRVVYSHAYGEHIAGAELRVHRSSHWGRIQDGSFPEEVASYVVGEDADHHFYEYTGAKDVASVYVGEQARLGDLFIHGNLQGVLQRYRIYDEAYVGTEFTVPYAFLNPRLGLNYSFSPRVHAYASISRTRREPRLKNLYDADSAGWGVTPDFETDEDGELDISAPFVGPETLVDVEAGAGYEGDRARGRAGVFVMDFVDEIVPSGGVDIYGQPRTANASKSTHAGLEAEAAVALGLGFELGGNVTFSRNRFDNLAGALGGSGMAKAGEVAFTEYCTLDSGEVAAVNRTGNTIAGFPDLMGNLRLAYRRDQLRVSVAGRFVGRHFTDNSMDTDCGGGSTAGDKVVDAYVVSNLSAGYTLPDLGLTLTLDVNNLTGGHQFIEGADGSIASVSPYVLMSGNDSGFFPLATRSAFLTVVKAW